MRKKRKLNNYFLHFEIIHNFTTYYLQQLTKKNSFCRITTTTTTEQGGRDSYPGSP